MLRPFFWAVILGLFASPAFAGPKEIFERQFWANTSAILAVTSDYSPRGITQSEEHLAEHGSIYYYDPNGLYVSGGITSIDYNYDKEAHSEVDLFAGYRWSKLGFNFEISEARYIYPGTFDGNDYSFWETRFDVNKNFGFADVTAKIKYSNDFWYETGRSFYTPVSAKVPLEKGFSLIGEVAYQSIQNNERFGISDYWHWSGGVAYDYNKYNFSAKYLDTDIKETQCATGCEPRIILTVMRFF